MDMDERIVMANKFIEDKADDVKAARKIIEVIRKFDNKVMDKRFVDASKEASGRYIRTEFGFGLTTYYLTMYTAGRYDRTETFSVPVNDETFSVTDSGRYRLKADGFTAKFEDRIKALEDRVKCLKEQIKNAPALEATMKEISEKLRRIKYNNDGELLTLLGLDYSLSAVGKFHCNEYTIW